MHVEAVRTDGPPSRTGLVRDYIRIECPQCWTAYHLHHDGLEMELLRGYFLRANWQISGEHPNHRQVKAIRNPVYPDRDRGLPNSSGSWRGYIEYKQASEQPCSQNSN